MQPEILRLRENDMREAAMLRRAALWERLPWLRNVHTPKEDEAYWRTHLLNTATVLGAVSQGRLAGVIAHGGGWVEQLYVLPAFQNRGIGSALLGRAKAAAEAGELRLWTFHANHPARRFYEAHGFAAEKETDGSGNEEREPDVLYLWRRQAGIA